MVSITLRSEEEGSAEIGSRGTVIQIGRLRTPRQPHVRCVDARTVRKRRGQHGITASRSAGSGSPKTRSPSGNAAISALLPPEGAAAALDGRPLASLLRILRTCARAPQRVGDGSTDALPASLIALADARAEHADLLSPRWIGRLVRVIIHGSTPPMQIKSYTTYLWLGSLWLHTPHAD